MSDLASDFLCYFSRILQILIICFKLQNLSTFIHNIPVEWVESTLRLSSSATSRRRRLPADRVFWLVSGMAIFRAFLIHEAARRLNICAQWLASYDLLTCIGLTKARKHLGADPESGYFTRPISTGDTSVIRLGCRNLDQGQVVCFLEKRSKPTTPRTVKMSKTVIPQITMPLLLRELLPSSRSFAHNPFSLTSNSRLQYYLHHDGSWSGHGLLKLLWYHRPYPGYHKA